MTMRMQAKTPVACAGAHAGLRPQRARPLRLSAFNGFVAPNRVVASCGLFTNEKLLTRAVNAQCRKVSPRSLRTVVCMAAKKSVGDLGKAELEGKVVLVRADLNVPLDKSQKITDDTRIRAAIPTLKYLIDNGAKVLLTSHLVSACPHPYLCSRATCIILILYVQGRPKDGPEDKFRLTPVVPRLSELLGTKVSDKAQKLFVRVLSAGLQQRLNACRCSKQMIALETRSSRRPKIFKMDRLVYVLQCRAHVGFQLLTLSVPQVLVLENVRFYKEETKNDPGFAEKVMLHTLLYLSARLASRAPLPCLSQHRA